MAYGFASASSQNLTVSNAIVGNYPLTLAAWSYLEDASATHRNIAIINSDASQRLAYINLINQIVYAGAATNGLGDNSTKGSYLSTTYFHTAGVYGSTTSRTAFLDGNAGTTDTVSQTPGATDRFAIGGYISAFLNGRNAEVAVWNAALTDAEIVSLSKGFKPTRVRPQSLIFYAPLVRDLQDLRGALTITNNNTATVADHPRVY